MALLDAAVRGDVDARPPTHVLLSQVVAFPYTTDLGPHFTAAGEDLFVG